MYLQDLQKFLDEAKDGVIYFSLGGNVRSDHMPEEKIQAFLEAFSELPQRILWKWESDILPGQPPNVKSEKWLPQQDILGNLCFCYRESVFRESR
jgi:glucuronosyltransferase